MFIIDLLIAASTLDVRTLTDQAVVASSIEHRLPTAMVTPSWGVVRAHVLETLRAKQYISTWQATACAKARACRIAEELIGRELENKLATGGFKFFSRQEWASIQQLVIDNTVGFEGPLCPLHNRKTGGPAGWAATFCAEIDVLLGVTHPRTRELALYAGNASEPTDAQREFIETCRTKQRAFVNANSYRLAQAQEFARKAKAWHPEQNVGVEIIGGCPIRLTGGGLNKPATAQVLVKAEPVRERPSRDIFVQDTTGRGYSVPGQPKEWAAAAHATRVALVQARNQEVVPDLITVSPVRHAAALSA